MSPDEFKASQHWVDGFLQRCKLSLGTSTTVFKLEDTEVSKRALVFKCFDQVLMASTALSTKS